jgi:hypothetical protein
MGRTLRVTTDQLKRLIQEAATDGSLVHSESDEFGTTTLEWDPREKVVYVDFLSAQGYDDSWVLEPGDKGYEEAVQKIPGAR